MITPEFGRVSSMVGARMTVAEFLKVPEEKPYLELFEGVVRQKAWAGLRHGLLQPQLAALLNRAAEDRGLGIAAIETEFVYGDSVLVPDISVYFWDRLPLLPNGDLYSELELPPNIAVEISSPEERVTDLVRKCVWYVEHGAQVVLLIHLDERSVLVFQSNSQVRVLTGPDRVDLGDVLPGFEITVAEIFDLLTLRRPTRGEAPAE